MTDDRDDFAGSARQVLSEYGRDYALGAVRALAVRNMISVDLPEQSDGFYPIVKIHEMALRELEELFYNRVQRQGGDQRRGELVQVLIVQKVWE